MTHDSGIKNNSNKNKKQSTSWGKVAGWYDGLLNEESSFQKDLILPNLKRLLEIKKGEKILDVACGQGFFAQEFEKLGAEVSGCDVSFELIEKARANSSESIKYIITPADKLDPIIDESFDKVSIILALQNIDNLSGTLRECSRVLRKGGKLYMVINHPSFRVPKRSDWGYDEKKMVQYRRVEQYLSEIMMKIDMNPGEKDIDKKEYTVSFHRPLQYFFNALNKSGFVVSKLEEWASNKKSESGPRQKAEDRARKEMPMFMYIEAVKG